MAWGGGSGVITAAGSCSLAGLPADQGCATQPHATRAVSFVCCKPSSWPWQPSEAPSKSLICPVRDTAVCSLLASKKERNRIEQMIKESKKTRCLYCRWRNK